MKTILLAIFVGGVAGQHGRALAFSEPPRTCFRTVAEAVALQHPLAGQDGQAARDGNRGFRVEDVRRDPLTNKVWAMVRSCDHPEQPSITVEAPEMAKSQGSGAPGPGYVLGAPVVKAGAAVRLVQMQPNVRLEMPAVAQSNGMLGDRIRVRVVRSTGSVGTSEQILVGIVRSPEVLELEQE